MLLVDCKNRLVISSAVADILSIEDDKPWTMSDFDYIVHVLNDHFNCDKVPMADIVVSLLDDCNQVITDKARITNVLVKYFGVPKEENKTKEKEQKKIMIEEFSETKKIVKWVVIGVVAALVLVTCINSCSVIGPTDEAATVTLGTVDDNANGPGLHFKAPFVQKFRKINKTPIEYSKTIPLGEKALITKDGQSLGIEFTLTWKYKDGSAVIVAKKYSTKDALYNLISNPCKQAFKSEIGQLEALEFVGKQDEVIAKVITRVTSEAVRLDLPIEVLNIVIDNINWDSGFETQIKKTAEMRAQVEQANQDALKEAANAQKKVAQAEAEKNAAVQTADAELIKAQKEAEAQLVKAQKEAEARKVRADAIAYENQKIAQNISVMQAQWKHEEEMARLEKWDGVQVSSQSVYIPNTYDLKSGK